MGFELWRIYITLYIIVMKKYVGTSWNYKTLLSKQM